MLRPKDKAPRGAAAVLALDEESDGRRELNGAEIDTLIQEHGELSWGSCAYALGCTRQRAQQIFDRAVRRLAHRIDVGGHLDDHFTKSQLDAAARRWRMKENDDE